MSEKVLIKGNEAIGAAAIRAGCRYYFGYPITPQSELPEYMAKELPKAGGTFLQAESEVSAINMVYGAAGAGARVMTSSSSPGFSLKQEGISYIAAAEIPCFMVNVQRGGPGLGTIQPAQSDYFQATKGGGHGDYRLLVIAPNSVQEIFDLTVEGFDLADRYNMPVLMLADGALGQMMEAVSLDARPAAPVEKAWAATGKKGRARANVIKTLYMDKDEAEACNQKLQAKYDLIKKQEVRVEEIHTDDAELVLVAYGICSRIARSALERARAAGLKVGLLRPITLFPFPEEAMYKAARTAKAFLTIEMSMGQMIEDVKLATRCLKPVHFYGRTGGNIPTVEEVYQQIVKIMNEKGGK